jgi:hypothetical protein
MSSLLLGKNLRNYLGKNLCGYFWLVSSLLTVSPAGVMALPLETFKTPLALTCSEGQRECVGVLRDDSSLGRHTGILIVKGSGGKAAIRVGRQSGHLKLEAEDVGDLTVVFSWDGDSNPEVLSGAGLNCFDITSGGAHAIIISKVSLDLDCSSSAVLPGCPDYSVESRIFDSADPTGQRFSASTVARSASDASDIVIPFSNFIRSGPRGKGSFNCAGAVTIALRFSGVVELDLELGPVYTNGGEGIQPPPIKATPTPEPELKEDARDDSTAVPTQVPTGASTAAFPSALLTPSDTLPVGEIKPRIPVVAEVPAPPNNTASAPVGASPPQSARTAPGKFELEDDVVYGSVVD